MQIRLEEIQSYAEQHGIPIHAVDMIVATEGFLRRAAQVSSPFALKGSFVTRQYLKEGWRRIPGDLDWVGLGEIDAAILKRWAEAIAACQIDDGIHFFGFNDDAFLRQVNYEMDEDFPTVNAEIAAKLGSNVHVLFSLDISYNIKLSDTLSAIDYVPLFGEPFAIPQCCSLEQHIGWKLHQCLIRPRFKDLFDLILLLRENSIEAGTVMDALIDECSANGTLLIGKFDMLFDGSLARHDRWQPDHYRQGSAEEYFIAWRNGDAIKIGLGGIEETLPYRYIGEPAIAATLPEFLQEFAQVLRDAGLAPAAIPGRPSNIAEQKHGAASGLALRSRRSWIDRLLGRG